MAITAELEGLVRDALGGNYQRSHVQNGELIVYVKSAAIRDAVTELRSNPHTHFNHLSYITALDLSPQEPRFEVIYELFSHEHKFRVRLKCQLNDTGDENTLPAIDSIADLFLTANWHERETYDLFGINFRGHPDLRRILLPELWDGHPLRREYPFDGKLSWKVGTSVKEKRGTAERSLGLEPDPEPVAEED
jgi:NADH-quinone oxidoreductase subunit C